MLVILWFQAINIVSSLFNIYFNMPILHSCVSDFIILFVYIYYEYSSQMLRWCFHEFVCKGILDKSAVKIIKFVLEKYLR